MSHADEDHDGDRRDFLYYATGGAGAVVAGAAIWPLVNQMNPSADVLALSSIRVDVGDVEPGTQIKAFSLVNRFLSVAARKKKSTKPTPSIWPS